MTTTSNMGATLHSQKRTTLRWIIGLVASAILAIALAGLAGLRINLTPSEPLGLWRIAPLDRPVAVGDVVFICPPLNPVMREALERGYFRRGLCDDGIAPLIKTVLALPSQHVEIGDAISVDGKVVPHSNLAKTDGKGRPLVAFRGGEVPEGEVFVFSDYVGSFDSRYFGPLPTSGILGFAKEVLTYAP